MQQDLSQQELQALTNEAFFEYAKKELHDIQGGMKTLKRDIQILVDKAKQKHILHDIVTKY